MNIQIPLLLGSVVNVVTKYTSDTASNFIEDIKEPAVRLMSMYGLQVIRGGSEISICDATCQNQVLLPFGICYKSTSCHFIGK